MALDVGTMSRDNIILLLSQCIKPLSEYSEYYNQQVVFKEEYRKYAKRLSRGRTHVQDLPIYLVTLILLQYLLSLVLL